MNQELLVELVKVLPQGALSRAWGWLARRRRPKVFVEVFKRSFAKLTRIDMREAGAPIGTYPSLEALFVRTLRPGARRVDPDPQALVSPVDGAVGVCGTVEQGTLLQVKGRRYGLARLLGELEQAERFEGGNYMTLYLAPNNYHRVHAPFSGEIRAATVIPGGLLPVFPTSLQRVDEVFARNERLITYIDSPDAGRIAVVKVGAMLVGRISVTYDAEIRTNETGTEQRQLSYSPPRLMTKGAEIGAFELGSTVVLLGEPGRLVFERIAPGTPVKMGGRIGVVVARKRKRKGRVAKNTKDSAVRAASPAGHIRRKPRSKKQ